MAPTERFEAAVEAVIAGDTDALRALLREYPGLSRQRSARAHRATLLHYVAANGVEDERQKSPPNAVDVTRMLLDAGAEVDALAETYGGGAVQTTLNLLVSSVHPYKAGVQVPVLATLLDYGAALNGVEDDRSPLITSLAFYAQGAARLLAQRGARVDTIATAAGLDDVDKVRGFLTKDGTPMPLIQLNWMPFGADPQANLELAAAWAKMYGHQRVLDLLVEHGVNPEARDNWGHVRS